MLTIFVEHLGTVDDLRLCILKVSLLLPHISTGQVRAKNASGDSWFLSTAPAGPARDTSLWLEWGEEIRQQRDIPRAFSIYSHVSSL